MKCIILAIIYLTLCTQVTASAKFKIPKTILKKLSKKALKKFSSEITGSLLSSSLRENVKEPSHGGYWNLKYFDQKFEMIASTFVVLQKEMDHLSEIVELNQHRFPAKRTRDIIMKSVIFIMIATIICAVIFIGLKMRKNVYFKRMQSLISSLAGLKSDLKARANILKTSEDITNAQRRNRELNEDISLVQHSAAGNIMEYI